MRRGAWRWFAPISILILTALSGEAGRRASYGGDLRVRTSGQLVKLGPTFSPMNAAEAALRLRLLPLVFEGLVKLNDQALPEAVLAASWTCSADFRRWTFSVRPGALFHDGAPVAASIVVDCLTTVENPFIVHEYEGRIVIESADPMPDLLKDLAMPERAISRTRSDGVTVGTGPFRIEQWEPGKRGVLVAFEEHWAGRPFVDRIVLEMGQPPRNQWMDLELGRADVIEVPVEEVRNTVQRGYRILTSRPLELMALSFSSQASSTQDLDLRRALALAIDRDAILRVLLQRQGEAAGSLLPQWIGGYGFLFPVARDLTRARSLLPALGREPEFNLGYSASDRLARSISERLALDVQAAGIRVHPAPVQDAPLDSSTPALLLLRIPIGTLDEKRALMSLASRLELHLPEQTDWSQPESVFKAEREILKDLRVIPLFHLPACYAVGPRVRYQRPEDIFLTEGLHLESVWLEGAAGSAVPGSAGPGSASPGSASILPALGPQASCLLAPPAQSTLLTAQAGKMPALPGPALPGPALPGPALPAGGGALSFKTRLLLIIGTAVVAASTAGTWILLVTTTRAFEQLDEQRRLALIEQFRRTFHSRTEEIATRVRAIAQAESSVRMAIDLSRPGGEAGAYVNAAEDLAAQHSLDFLEVLDAEGRIISSAHSPASFGYLDPLGPELPQLTGQTAFLSRQELPDRVCIAMIAAAAVNTAGSRLYILGGERLDEPFLSTLALPAGMGLSLYQNVEPGFSPRLLTGLPAERVARLEPIVNTVLRSGREYSSLVSWSKDNADSARIQAIPLQGHDRQLLGVLMVASSRSEIVHLRRFIAVTGLIAGVGGVILGLGAGWWTTRRVSKPIQKLAEGARKVTRGNWNTRVYVYSRDEIGDLAKAFNQMTDQLLEQRDRLVQAERVAAWREVARRLAHELKNPLFPLQITLENLQRAKSCHPDQFDEVFEESTAAMLTELRSLKTIIGRFSEFSKMPQPELQPVDLNRIVEEKSTLFQSELAARTENRIELQTDLEKESNFVHADPEHIGRVLQNLILNSIDAMPHGGRLLIRTRKQAAGMLLEVEDTGVGLTPEERDRVFTPYYTTKQHGTGLGLAIVQSIISDHGGRIAVESEPGRGTIFRIWLAGS